MAHCTAKYLFSMKNPLTITYTADGSATIYNAEVGEHYHSKNGAVQESRHVFLQAGLQYYVELTKKTSVSILEVGFGTGLNFLLSADYGISKHIKLDYTGIEAYPLPPALLRGTGYGSYVKPALWHSFINLYDKALTTKQHIDYDVWLRLREVTLMEFNSEEMYDIVYFDAFAAAYQPEMWSASAIEKASSYIKPGGLFATYAITGNLKRTMKALGFSIEKIPGAAGKREMLRAVKNP